MTVEVYNPPSVSGVSGADGVAYDATKQGFKLVSTDPTLATTTAAAGTGLNGCRFDVETAFTLATAYVEVTTAPVTPTAGANKIGIFNSSGVLVGQTADMGTAGAVDWLSTGLKAMPVTAEAGQSLAFAAGDWFDVALLDRAGTQGQFRRQPVGSSTIINALYATQAMRWFTTAAQSTMPTTMPTKTSSTGSFWFGVA